MNRAARPLRLLLAALVSLGAPGDVFARELGRRDFPPVAFNILDEVKYEACSPGLAVVPANAGMPHADGSPAPSLTPQHNSLNLAPSVWGLGWHESSDSTLRPEPDGRVAWTDGTGAERAFSPLPPSSGNLSLPADAALRAALLAGGTVQLAAGLVSSGPPVYRSPVGTFESLVYSSGTAQKVPTELRLESLNGDVTTFRVFESSSVLRPALLVDRNGNTLTYARDGQGRLIKVTDVHGRFTELTYENGLVKTLSDHAGRTVTYGYDGSGRKTGEDGFAGHTGYAYDGASARIARITYPNGSFRRYEYNDPEHRVTLEASDGDVDKLTYVYESTRTLVTDALGQTTIHELKNVAGVRRPAKVVDARGQATLLAYDADLNLTRREDPKANVTTYAYDAFGNPTQVRALAGTPTFPPP